MGDYYKYKKVLVILMIISCGFSIIKNIFKSKVEASEAVEVTPNWQDGSYTVQSDNNYLTLMNNQLSIQDNIISKLMDNVSNNRTDTLIQAIGFIKERICYNWNGAKNRIVWFGLNTDSNIEAVWFYQEITTDKMNNIVFADARLNNGYKLINQPFYNVTRNGSNQIRYFNNLGEYISYPGFNPWEGSINVPVAEAGYYSPRWVDLFQMCGLIDNSGEYESAFAELQETTDLNYTANLYTKEAVQNTYSYITNGNTETITETGINQPEVSQPDLSDTFDTLTDLLTNENYHSKNFSLTLPNNDKFNFSLDPDFLKTSLTRVGGTSLVTIIQTLWYIGLYGIMIFMSLKIIGSLLAGDLDSVVGSFSPVNSVVNSSLESTGAFRLGDNHDGAFRKGG